MKLIEIFKTDVPDKATARLLVRNLKSLFPHSKINFDLEDCDNILRIESSKPIDVRKVTFSLAEQGHRADVLN
ncbi:hypothetical protein A8C56_14980 [Niabella ginsenosidivorans]|uniref:Methyltransferase type 11 n=1 Tax=Niabella ginsenosidivorans TaxID=1176587 RepID=A0A1A9I6D7_9BACT|nr:hypothetical protein [Niabella ginsenosidivorans]ANH82104.1 hypothetical protein A8C56_14980 [Niabella ginsenosidivorans]